MGTWQAGKEGWVGIQDKDSIRAVRSAFDLGITTFDTAAIYGNGHSERILGEALADVRREVVYATKVPVDQLTFEQVIASCHQSMDNLQTDYIDLLQIHWPSGFFGSDFVSILETINAMVRLKQEGKIRSIGLSNFSLGQLKEAVNSGHSIDSIQIPFSLFWRHVYKDICAFCTDNNVAILGYSSLAQGLLTGRFGTKHGFTHDDNRSMNKLFRGETFERTQTAINRLRIVAERNRVTIAQLAIAWCLDKHRIGAIFGARNENQVAENVRSIEISLSEEDLAQMETIAQIVTDHLDDDPVMWLPNRRMLLGKRLRGKFRKVDRQQ